MFPISALSALMQITFQLFFSAQQDSKWTIKNPAIGFLPSRVKLIFVKITTYLKIAITLLFSFDFDWKLFRPNLQSLADS